MNKTNMKAETKETSYLGTVSADSPGAIDPLDRFGGVISRHGKDMKRGWRGRSNGKEGRRTPENYTRSTEHNEKS